MAEYQPAQLDQLRKPAPVSEGRSRKEAVAATHPLLTLQSRAGNQAIARMIQRDGAEEALQMKHDGSLQRSEEAEEEAEVQAKHDSSLQRSEEAEEEAEVQAKHDGSLQRSEEAEEEPEVQAKHDGSLQRSEEAEEEPEVQAKHDSSLQRSEEAEEEAEVQMKHDSAPQVGLEGGAVGGAIESSVNSMRGQGSGVPDRIRTKMEEATGADLSSVRVHEGEQADTLNRQLTAKAFTTGSDIFLRSDSKPADSQLMAHELAHVVQQVRGEPRPEEVV